MYLCLCYAVNETSIKQMISEKGCASLQSLQRECKAGMSCGRCVPKIKNYLSVETTKTPCSSHHEPPSEVRLSHQKNNC